MTKTCEGCGKEFSPKTKRAVRCRKNCGRSSESRNGARASKRKNHDLTFVGIDGEGVTSREGIHEYVLLSVGDRSLYREDKGHLHWREIFPFLYNCFIRNPNAVYVGYFLGYDFTQWFCTLPESRARLLFTKEGIAKRSRTQSGNNPRPFPVHLGEWEWEIDILGMKRFQLRPGTGYPPGMIKNKYSWMTICDVGSFFQMSFIKAINPADWKGVSPVVTPEEYELIQRGKERRSTAVFDEEMVRYNILENEVLARLMKTLNEGFTGIGIRLNRKQWFGPGQAASAWMKSLSSVPRSNEVFGTVPVWAREAARKTYFGGWFEIFAHGCVHGTSYEYDINSAYPYIISQLPCLLHGRWTRSECTSLSKLKDVYGGSVRMVYGQVVGRNSLVGGMLHRTPKGRVLRPRGTKGWFWEHELKAAMRADLVDEFHIESYIRYDACDCQPPFADIERLYQRRLQVGKKTPQGRAYKLVYNSAYGKMAQSIGSPEFANPIYASLITAGCRKMILDAIAYHPTKSQDLLMVATDGVYFKTRHDQLTLDKEKLGCWDETEKHNLTLFMPGIYWDDKSRERVRRNEAPELKSRGISASDLSRFIDDIDEKFTDFNDWPSIELPIRFNMVSPMQALSRGKWETCGVVAIGDSRKLSSNPEIKRIPELFTDGGIIRTECYWFLDPVESEPYNRYFGDELALTMELDDVMSPDGSLNMILPEMLNE